MADDNEVVDPSLLRLIFRPLSLIAMLTALLVFWSGVFFKNDTLEFKNYQISIPQWAGLLNMVDNTPNRNNNS